MKPKLLVCFLAASALALIASCGGGGSGSTAPPAAKVTRWPAPSNPLELAVKAGLTPEVKEFVLFHVHAHLDVFVNGAAVVVPAGIGINIDDPGVKRGAGPSYGSISMCSKPCISPLHTHATDGVLHTESKSTAPNKLGQFFIEWDVKLDANCVAEYCSPQTPIAIYVNGKKFTGDPTTIELTNLKEIAIVIGTPPSGGIPKEFPKGVSG
jgi:hypothetical protein